MKNLVFGKNMKNVWKHRDIKLIAREKRENYLVTEINCYTKKILMKFVCCKTKKRSNTH